MARIDVLPSIEIIRGFKGILDFYLWRGLPCVRAWPKYRPAKQTAASLAAALVFGAIVKSYSLLGDGALVPYRADAADQPRTARDIMVTGVYGNLHEASMSDFLDLLVECRDFLSHLTALLDALHSVDTDELVARIEHSVLPDDAATHTRQLTILAALQKLDDLQDTLESKALDRLLVRGMDQLFSLKAALHRNRTAVISGAGGYVDSLSCSANQVWVITSVCANDATNATTGILMMIRSAGSNYQFHEDAIALAANIEHPLQCEKYLYPTDLVRVYYRGALAGDSCSVRLTGYIMTLEP